MARRRGGLFCSAAEAAEILGVGRTVFRRWVARGIVPKYVDEDTGTVHYPRPQLERLAAELHTEPASVPPRRRLRVAPNADVPEVVELPKVKP